MRQGFGSSRGLGSSSRVACHDCGNQAKRDCVYMRCRTCCKTRGFRCRTHVKSTWVPAYRRRHSHHHHQQDQPQQQLLFDASATSRQPVEQPLAVLSPRRDHRPENLTPGGEEGLMFPPEITSPAIFRCVVVRSSDNNVVEQYAYQTAVSIGGHLFKGILYDQGPELQHPIAPHAPRYHSGEGPSSYSNAPLEHPFATTMQRSVFPSSFQTPLDAASANPASGTHVFFHQRTS